jgi:hypothetical protein
VGGKQRKSPIGNKFPIGKNHRVNIAKNIPIGGKFHKRVIPRGKLSP